MAADRGTLVTPSRGGPPPASPSHPHAHAQPHAHVHAHPTAPARPRARTGALPVGRRRTLHALAIGTWVTGGIWLIFKYFVREVDSFGFDNPHPAQRWWLIGHAAFSFGALWIYGALWPDHVVRGWKAKLRRKSGGTIFGVAAWLALTGCALYYIGNDTARSWTSLAHWIVGLAAIVAYLIHQPWRKRGP
jgi:hypothetical protein